MCGIAGIVDFKTRAAARVIGQLSDALRHRGPDDEGFVCFDLLNGGFQSGRGRDTPSELGHLPSLEALRGLPCEVALAHRRLSILDLSPAGHGPLANADCSLWISYNGEVYNYLELREELRALGYSFASGTDTEVILAAYQAWGVDCLRRFNGMFAFAIWDVRAQRLFCARDRFGIKPFYYVLRDGYLAFASEIKALLADPHQIKQARPQTIYEYLANGALGADEETFFEGIQALRGGHALTFDQDQGLKMWPYYSLPYQTDYKTPNFNERAEQFRELLTDAIRLRLRSDVPIGSALSGGLDSSSVVVLANGLLKTESGLKAEIVGEQQRVFCAVYAGEKFNEQPYMQTVIDATGAQAHFTQPNSAALWDDLPHMVYQQDEPVSGSSVYAQYCVMRLARERGVTVLLDGQGADETLAGYHFYYGYLLAQALRGGRVKRALQEAVGARQIAGVNPLMLLALTGWNLSPSALRRIGWRMGGARMLSHKPIDAALLNVNFAAQNQAAARVKHEAYPTLAQKLYDDVLHSNLPTLLRYEDRNSMAFHIEARVPFLDYRLVELAFSLGADAHIRDGWTKAVLREGLKGHLPETIRARRDKEGYTTPHDRWLGELRPQIKSLFSGDVRSAAYLSDTALKQLRSDGGAGLAGAWRMINLELWLRAFDLA